MKNRSSLLAAICVLALAGCDHTLRQDMANQPRHNPLSPAEFFQDGRSERPIIENTVARGSIENDKLAVPKESNAFPLPLTMDLLKRGEDRYDIFCSPCRFARRRARHGDLARDEAPAVVSPGPIAE